jgi:hypothetical protein
MKVVEDILMADEWTKLSSSEELFYQINEWLTNKLFEELFMFYYLSETTRCRFNLQLVRLQNLGVTEEKMEAVWLLSTFCMFCL